MTRTSLTTSVRVFAAACLIAGSTLTFGSMDAVQASISGQGSTITGQQVPTEATIRGADMRFIEAYEQADAAGRFALGLVLIVLGFMLHGLVISQEERRVPVRSAPAKKRRQQKPHSWFWIEMRI